MIKNDQRLQFSLFIAVLLALIACDFIMAAVPPVSRDALTHHLALPKLWITIGGIHETPDIEFSYYPMNLDLLYAVPLMIGNDILPKYIHMAFGLATAFLIYLHLTARLHRIYALVGVLLFLSLPVIVKLSITVYVDLGLIFFSTAALMLMLEWQHRGFRSRYLLGAACCCGMALGTKYNAMVVFVLMTLMVPFISAQAGRLGTPKTGRPAPYYRALRDGFVFASVALLVFSPWAVRNLIWTGNPLYPLYDGLFNPQSAAVESGMHPFVLRKLVYGESLLETILIPIRIFFQGRDDMPALFDGRLNPYLLFLPIFGVLREKTEPGLLGAEKKLMAAFAGLFILIVFFTRDMRIRYIAPAIPPLVLLSVYGLHYLLERITRIQSGALRQSLKTGVCLLVLAGIGANAIYIVDLFGNVRPLDYLSGRLSRDAYIEAFRPEHAAVQYANRSMNKGDRALCLFLGNRRYYFDVDVLFYEWQVFQSMVADADTPAALSETLRRQGISHLVVGLHHLQEWSPRTLSKEDQLKLARFMAEEFDMLFEKNGYAVLRFRNSEAGTPIAGNRTITP